ncbi:MAG TPA: rhomboid family intramembrane serine protease [Thermoanaerobaculia bacterium]|nr:rhomboid family intramembrane serine protease [Thermoanaerobaculia bacterium]
MIPLRDTIPRRTIPFVTRLLVVANVAAFVLELLQGDRLEEFVNTFAFVPARLFHPGLFPGWTAGAAAVTIFTAMFLHGGLLHLAGNMLFLWIFGDNVEDALGHSRYLFFYLLCGTAATLLQGFLAPDSLVPNLGASGAIAGVLGAYFVLYPRARVVTIVPLFVLFPLVEIPAGLYLLGWFLMQFWMGSSQLASAGRGQSAPGGVAFWAHVGGFLAGVAWVLLFRPKRAPPLRYRIS